MNGDEAAKAQAEYAPNPSNSTGLEMPARDCCEGLPVGDAGDYVQPPSILQQADAVAGQDRSRDYGHPFENHQRIADIWNIQLGKKLNAPIEPREVALLMIGLKLAREINTPKYDNILDIAGYVKCVAMIDERTAKITSK